MKDLRSLRDLESISSANSAITKLFKMGNSVYFISSRDNYSMDQVEKDTNFWLKEKGFENYRLIIYSREKELLLKNWNWIYL